MEIISDALRTVVQDLFGVTIDPVLTRPDEQFGDYATNLALQLAKQVNRNPREIAEVVADHLRKVLKDTIKEVSVAGPGFINIRFTDSYLLDSFDQATK